MLERRAPEFSERMFEFAYNAEYCRTNFAFLAAAPYIPNQRMERLLAYDVALRIKKGAPVSSLFLQHKVATKYWVPVGQKTSSHYSAALGSRYFRFGLNNRQYNRILFLRTKKATPIFFCAPKFTSESWINKYFLSSLIEKKSIWIDIAGAGRLVGANFHKSHSIGYRVNESRVLRFSNEPERLGAVAADARGEAIKARRFDEEYLRGLLSDIKSAVAEIDLEEGEYPDLSRPIPSRFEDLVVEVSYWAATKLRASWLLKPIREVA